MSWSLRSLPKIGILPTTLSLLKLRSYNSRSGNLKLPKVWHVLQTKSLSNDPGKFQSSFDETSETCLREIHSRGERSDRSSTFHVSSSRLWPRRFQGTWAVQLAALLCISRASHVWGLHRPLQVKSTMPNPSTFETPWNLVRATHPHCDAMYYHQPGQVSLLICYLCNHDDLALFR